MTAKENVNKVSILTKIASWIGWIIIWPFAAAIPIAIAFGVSYAIVFAGTKEPSILTFQITVIVAVSILVACLSFIKHLMASATDYFIRAGKKVISGYLWLGILTGAGLLILPTIDPATIKPPLPKDSRLMTVLSSVGAKPEKLEDVSLGYVDTYPDQMREGEYQPYLDANGVFIYGNITIKKNLDPEAEKIDVAHEYLHHIWQVYFDETTKHDLTSHLMTMYGRDKRMQQRVASYSETNMLIPTELFSFYCTEFTDQYLTTYVLQKCNEYITRSALKLT